MVTNEEVRHWDYCIYTYRAVSSRSKELLLPIKASPSSWFPYHIPATHCQYLLNFRRQRGICHSLFSPIHEPRQRGPHSIRLGQSVSCILARSKVIIFSLGVTDPNYKLILCQVMSLSSKFDTEVDFFKLAYHNYVAQQSYCDMDAVLVIFIFVLLNSRV